MVTYKCARCNDICHGEGDTLLNTTLVHFCEPCSTYLLDRERKVGRVLEQFLEPKLTNKDRKEWSIKIWTWLSENPTAEKKHLPNELKVFKGHTLAEEYAECPLCTHFLRKKPSRSCDKCPIGRSPCLPCNSDNSAWLERSYRLATHQSAEGPNRMILKAIKGWKI